LPLVGYFLPLVSYLPPSVLVRGKLFTMVDFLPPCILYGWLFTTGLPVSSCRRVGHGRGWPCIAGLVCSLLSSGSVSVGGAWAAGDLLERERVVDSAK
jgi:hypothetical protein